MTDLQRDKNAAARLTQMLRKKCGDSRFRVLRIRWSDLPKTVEVDGQLDHPDGSIQPVGTISVRVELSLGVGPPQSVFDDEVLEAVVAAFPCERVS